MEMNKCVLTFIILIMIACASHAQIKIASPQLMSIPYPSHIDSTYYRSSIMLPSYDPNGLPLFCKYEHLSDRHTGLKLRFRLGSIDYVDRLEKKSVGRNH